MPVHPISKILNDKINEIPHSHKKDFIFKYKLFLEFLLNIILLINIYFINKKSFFL